MIVVIEISLLKFLKIKFKGILYCFRIDDILNFLGMILFGE